MPQFFHLYNLELTNMNSKYPSGSRLWDSVKVNHTCKAAPTSATLRSKSLQAPTPNTCESRLGQSGGARGEQGSLLSITPVEGPPAPPNWKAWKPGPRPAPASGVTSLCLLPSLTPTPPLELRGWAGMWKAPASSHIYYFRIPPPLAVSVLHCWSPRLPMCPLEGTPQTSLQPRNPSSLASSAPPVAPCRVVGRGDGEGLQEGSLTLTIC